MIVDLTQPIETSADLAQLRRILSALVGQPFLKAEFSYGDELKVHFGNPVPYISGRMPGKTKGAWRLATRGSHWRFVLQSFGRIIESEPVLTTTSEGGRQSPTNAEIEHAIGPALAGQIVSHASLLNSKHGIGASLLFEDGSTFAVWPSDEPDDADQEGEPIADWELFTPFGMYLRVGPELVWQYVSGSVAVASV